MREEIARVRDDNRRLHERIEALERAGKRQSAPFSKGTPKRNPKTPGGKPGDRRPRARRAVPGRVDEVIEVGLPACCPHCSGALRLERCESQFHVDIPDPRIRATEFQIQIGACLGCGRRVQARHALQTSDALGAANVQLGPRLVATATLLNKGLGISHEKVADALSAMFGLEVSRSGLARAIDRVGTAAEPTYDAICDAVAASEVVVPVAPALFGMFWGVPLVAREMESGTHRLVWTQGVTRRRWITSKLAVVMGSAALASHPRRDDDMVGRRVGQV